MACPISTLNRTPETAARIKIDPSETAQGSASLFRKLSPFHLRNPAREILEISPASDLIHHLIHRMVLLLLVAAFAAPFVTACANLPLLSDTELQDAVSTEVKRNTLAKLDPQISDYYRKSYGERFANPNLTYVPDVLLKNLIAGMKGPAFTAAAAWNVSAILDCRFPSLTKSMLDQLSHGDSYVILLSLRYVDSSLGIREKFILVHEVFHFVQYERDQLLYKWDCSQPSTLEEYLKQPDEREAYKAEMRYAQTVLKVSWEQYFYDRFGMAIFSSTYFRETLRKLWDDVEGEKGKAAKRSSSAHMFPLSKSAWSRHRSQAYARSA